MMVIIALAGFYGAYTWYQHNAALFSAPATSTMPVTVKLSTGAKTGNPLLDYDIDTVERWFNYSAGIYGDSMKPKVKLASVDVIIQNVKQDTGINITREQVLDPTVQASILKRWH